ncbi:MAG TPA: helix-turn-helix domain-containing protein [Candidatus Limnocylindria bacterium]|nr:helix-turn-helix domain-containing protein [Candidatus Limnocylindria bacterium]
MINQTLDKLGMSDKEAAIYLAVLQQGRALPTHISKMTKINRTTVYSVAKDLVEKGFIVEDLGGKNTYLVAVPPQDLKHLIRKEEKAFENKKKSFESAIGELEDFAKNTKYFIPKITFVQEEDLESYLYKRSDEWHASIMKYDGTIWGFQDHTFAGNYEKWIDWEWRVGGPKNLQLRFFSNKSGVEKKNKNKDYAARRQIKYWNKTTFTASIWVQGDYLIMLYTHSRPHHLVEIYDPLMAANTREFFKGVWEQIE